MNSSPAGIRPIAVIGGTGPAGMGLALRWARAGETIIIGSRDEKRAQQAAAAIQQGLGGQAKIAGMENSALYQPRYPVHYARRSAVRHRARLAAGWQNQDPVPGPWIQGHGIGSRRRSTARLR